MPPDNSTLQIAIVDDSKGEKCDAHCGIDWSAVESIALARKRIKYRFGDGIQLEYLDLSQPLSNHQPPEPIQGIKDSSLPLLLINGEPRISGQFDYRQLLDVIEAEVELNHERKI